MQKILIAEDDKFLSRALGEKFKKVNFEVLLVKNGNEALKMIKSNKPDLALLDVMMPEKNGFEVLEELKLDNSIAKVPVIIISNLGQDSDIRKGKELGAIDYIVKSDTPLKDMVEKVQSHLAKLKKK